MKTKELIEELRRLDPNGDTDVVLHKSMPIHYVERLPGYYDGCYEQLIEDPAQKPYYAVLGTKIKVKDDKICLIGLSYEDVVFNEDDDSMNKPILDLTEVQECYESKLQKYKNWDKKLKEEKNQMKSEVRKSFRETQIKQLLGCMIDGKLEEKLLEREFGKFLDKNNKRKDVIANLLAGADCLDGFNKDIVEKFIEQYESQW